VLLFVIFIFTFVGCSKDLPVVKFWVPSAPYSSDPVDSNYIVHQAVFRSVFGTLVSRYRIGQYTGVFADYWDVSTDKRTWRFHVRSDLFFEDGRKIDAETIVRSFVRNISILTSKGNVDPLLANIVGVRPFLNVSESVAGIRSVDGFVEFRLKVGRTDFLDIVSRSPFFVVSPDDYNATSGVWVNLRKVTASGPYRVTFWDDNVIRLKRRSGYLSSLFYSKLIDEVHFTWNIADRSDSDFVLGHSLSDDLGKTHEFTGGLVSGIAYVRCHSWKLKGSFCGNSILRRQFKELFYDEWRKRGFNIERNFFPARKTHGESVSSGVKFDDTKKVIWNGKVRYLISHSLLNPYFREYGAVVRSVAQQLFMSIDGRELAPSDVIKENNPDLSAYDLDLSVRATEVDFSALNSELISMFISSDGLRLPDVDGKLSAVVRRSVVDIEKINQIIEQQGVLWPLVHFSQGLYVKKNRFDISWLNMMLPPIELQWVGWQ
jgi:hypothetical protein